jgi:GH15 family glucan-1,4-alpha-glucosidase
MTDLVKHSIDVILQYQAPSGAYIASPNFSNYRYSWFRDGTFTAYAMDVVGQHESSKRFHQWAASVIERFQGKITALIAQHEAGEQIDPELQMHTRFTLDGYEANESWTNFQLDGYGTWLWGLVDHVRRTDNRALYEALRPQAMLVARYLCTFWQTPCFDCWEEFNDKQHISTMAALYGGLHALAEYDPSTGVGAEADRIRAFILDQGVKHGHLVKFLGKPESLQDGEPIYYEGDREVDASLIGVATPYRVLEPNDPLMRATIEKIERDLVHNGVYRYNKDVYFGGGEWVLLAAWLGWHYVEAGNLERARTLRDWVAAQADDAGDLPEQVNGHTLTPEMYQPWVERWGPVAKPLLWSHAMYLILNDALGS